MIGGVVYSFGIHSAALDRALGSVGSGTPGNQTYGVRFTNDTGAAMSVSVAYTGEQWRDGGGATAVINKLQFSYQVSATAITSPDPTHTGAPWTAFTALDFASPINSLGNGHCTGWQCVSKSDCDSHHYIDRSFRAGRSRDFYTLARYQ